MVIFSPSTHPLKGRKKKMDRRREGREGGGKEGEKIDLDSGFKNTYTCKSTVLQFENKYLGIVVPRTISVQHNEVTIK